jgi:hypothetical protein
LRQFLFQLILRVCLSVALADSALSHRVAVGGPFSVPNAVAASSTSNADQRIFVIKQTHD